MARQPPTVCKSADSAITDAPCYPPALTSRPPPRSIPPSLLGPSNKFALPPIAHDFAFNYYNAINKITKAHHRAWHQQVCHPAQPTLLRSFGLASLHSCARGGFGLRLPASASLRRDGPPTQELATVARSRGGFDESTPTHGSATAPTCGEPTQPPSYPLRGVSPRPLHSSAPDLPSRASPIAH